MKQISIILISILLIFAITGCSVEKGTEKSDTTETQLANAFEEDASLLRESSGQIGFGYLFPPEDGYVYDSTEVSIPYYIENMGKENETNAKVGLMFFVDGEVQPCSIFDNDELSAENTFHYFSLAPGERVEFDVKFKPISGTIGEEIGVIPAVIWNPNYMPANSGSIRFGNCYSLSTNIPLTIKMEQDGMNNHTPSSLQYEIMDIPEAIMLSLENVYANESYDILNESVGFEIETENNILLAKNGKVDITINLYGGKQVKDKITIFINNQPIEISGGDYIEVNTQNGKMCKVQATIDVSHLESDSVLYAVVMTTENDYVIQDIFMTQPVLIDIK